ncbi:MAG TPA: SurA N-terminal domain-containing protein [Vicinamibacterales bacterium]|nr:SurA N-terminal domain-containing protein [Vicinamibacterales bacterium]
MPSKYRSLRCRVIVAAMAVCLTAGCATTSEPPPSPDVWATVDGRDIHRSDVEKAYRRVAQASPALSEEEALAGKLSLLNELILQDILVARAGALGIDVSETELDAAFNDRKKNMTDDAFQKELQQRGLSVDDMKAGLRRELLADKLIEREVISKVSVSDQEVADFYNANRAQFHLAETAYRLAQIVVTPVREQQVNNRQKSDAATPAAAERKVRQLMERLRSGTSFRELAMDYSEDPETAPRGGDLGFVPLSSLKQVAPVLRDAVLKTEPGSVSQVSVGGAHTLVLVVSREEAGQRELGEPAVREGIVGTLRDRRQQLLRAAYLTTVRNDARVVNHLARQIVAEPARNPTLTPAAPEKQ